LADWNSTALLIVYPVSPHFSSFFEKVRQVLYDALPVIHPTVSKQWRKTQLTNWRWHKQVIAFC